MKCWSKYIVRVYGLGTYLFEDLASKDEFVDVVKSANRHEVIVEDVYRFNTYANIDGRF